MKKKIAFVIQRYGLEVNGGSELSCRLIAERLTNDYDVEIITSKAIDYVTWKNEYTENIEVINSVTVRRFSVTSPRDNIKFDKINTRMLTQSHSIHEEYDWMENMGPHVPDLLTHLEQHKDSYDKIIYYTYLYYPTYFGIHIAPEKSIFVPTAHDEPYIYLNMFNSEFNLPKYLLFLTQEEKHFVQKRFNNAHIQNDVIGIGVDCPDELYSKQNIMEKYNLPEDYIIYAGRIDESKGCKEMLNYYMQYIENVPNAPQLVLIGKAAMDIPNNPKIRPLGFVNEKEKYSFMKYAKALIMPSQYESFSMVVIESLSLEVPVVVNAKCDVLVGHCVRSNGGLYYNNVHEFAAAIEYIIRNPEVSSQMGVNGKLYVDSNYSWDVIITKFKDAIES
ncbi:hypothetical protein SY83_13130 [Paenibacillus swuensis]|uniref:Glycosyl transferase family 1 domain-containing protein n=1 Tax=Paenibacillus swuensis TaxID=1178515 RepID=A0A172TJB0_9BACL|nr:glycosyltransferase family 4 protein [Paenibacillus swuensis]ANE47052.1 hypothetical protein SY83_13130 [Paenibacillus swuensis]